MTLTTIALVLCAASLALLPAGALAAGPESAAAMYSPGDVYAIDLTLPQASMEALENEPESDEYVEGQFAIAATDGTPGGTGAFTAPQKVEVRLKGGNGSFRFMDEKAAFKLKFPKTELFRGLRRMTLNNMVQDPSMVHETMTYELFRALELPASRTGYAFLRINGVPYGVYLNLETLDNVSLPQWFASTQHLYEADAPGTDVTADDTEKFEIDEGDEEDISDLEALIAAANDTVGDWSDGMAAVADLTEMARMWAVERYTGHWDGYAGREAPFRPNNYYLHSLDSGVFEMVPWGADQTWEVPLEFDEPAGGVLFNNCVADASCAALYEAGLAEVESGVPALELDTRAICTAEMLAPWQALEEPERREHDAEEIAEGVDDARTFVSLRPGELAAFLGTEAPDVPGGTDPCPEEEKEEEGQPQRPTDRPADNPPLVGPPVPPETLRVGAISAEGRWLKARVSAPASGRLRIVAKTLGRRGSTVCSGRREVGVPGGTRLSCRLSGAVLKTLENRSLRLGVEVTFRGAGPAVEPVARSVTLPRR
ncbi:MAG TPA: CotH kinase family protein [Solirubrobacterales bacterium]|nr:CotH kinase family protein [Solirubrobacterales bacterium]